MIRIAASHKRCTRRSAYRGRRIPVSEARAAVGQLIDEVFSGPSILNSLGHDNPDRPLEKR